MDLAQSLPRLRTDLQAQPIDGSDGRFAVDVTDPASGQTFRFWDVEYHLATAMNGQRDLDALASWADAELGLKPSPDELMNVIEKLDELGYLELSAPEVPAPALGHFTSLEPSPPPLAVDDLTLGLAGAGDAQPDDVMPEAANLELGFAGNEGTHGDEQPTYVAPNLSLGRAGDQRLSSGFPAEDEDDVPTSIKDPRDQNRASDPAIPPRPPTGQEPMPSLRPTGSADDDEGPTQLPAPATDFDDEEMSVDLTDHMKLGPEAVKEAVRQSQMIQAVDVDDLPPEGLDTPAEAKDASEPAEARDPDKDKGKPESVTPTELPPRPVSVSKPVDEDDRDRPIVTATETPAPQSRTGLVILVLLLLLVAAAAAVYFLNLFDVRQKLGLEGDKAAETTTPSTMVAPKTQPPVKIELPSATLEEKANDPVEVKATQAGTLTSIVASGTEVEEGQEIARFRGGEAFEREIANTTLRLDHYQGKLDKAKQSGNEGEIDRAQKKVDEKKATIAEAEAGLEAFIVRAPQAGTFSTELEANAKVEADAVIGTFPTAPSLIATFDIPAGSDAASLEAGSEAEVASKTDDKKRAGCQVTAVEGAKVTVECAAEGGLVAGDVVVLP